MSQVLRIIDGEAVWVDKKSAPPASAVQKPIVSDALGCIAEQVEELRADAKLHGFTDIEFTPDPSLTMNGQPFAGWYQCRSTSPDQWRRYVEHRGYADRNSKNGSAACASDIEMAQGAVVNKYGKARTA